MIGCRFESVQNVLCGTVLPPLSSSNSLIALNTTLAECANSLASPTVSNTAEFTIQIPNDRNQFSDQTSAQLFSDCKFTSTTPSSSFNIIEYSDLAGSLSLTKCSFIVQIKTAFIGVVKLYAKKGVFPVFLFDQSSVTFSRSDGSNTASNQFLFHYSPNTYFISSNFSSPSETTSSNARTIGFTSSLAFATVANCIFSNQSTSSFGSCLYDSQAKSVALITNTIFRGNWASTGGAISLGFTNTRIVQCVFSDNTADQLGGAAYINWPDFVDFEDVHFENNRAFKTFSTTNTALTHYRGNDINLRDASLSKLVSNMVGCTSSSTNPKLGYYNTDKNNGDEKDEDNLLPDPTKTSPTPLNKWWVDEKGSGTTCTLSIPCQTISTAFTVIKSSPETTVFNLMNVDSGTFQVEAIDIYLSVEIVGKGWARNSSTFTRLASGGLTVSGNGNVSLTSLSLSPQTPSTTLVTVSSTTAQLRVTNVWIEAVLNHDISLFSFSAGSFTFNLCVFNTITLTSSPVVSVAGSSNLTIRRCWMMEIERKGGDGGSFLDSSTSGTVSIVDSDFANCRSSGQAGCLSFTASDAKNKVSLSNVYFMDNLANTSGNAAYAELGNDLSIFGFAKDQISLVTVQSISEKPHCLTNSSTSSFDSVPLSFSDEGIEFPISHRFKQALPLSWFTTINEIIDRITAVAIVDIRITTSVSCPLKQLTLQTKKISISQAPVTLQLGQDELIVLLDSSALEFRSVNFTTPNVLMQSPFLIQSSSASLLFYQASLLFSAKTHSAAFIQNSGGTASIHLMKIQAGLHFDSCSFCECSGGSISIKTTLFDSISSSSDGAVLNAKNANVAVSDSSFVNCSAQNGGVFAIELSGATYISILHQSTSTYDVTFSDNKAIGSDGTSSTPKGKGGVLFVNGTTTLSNPIRFSSSSTNDARFEQNFAEDGNDVFVSNSVFGGKQLTQLASFNGGSHSQDFRVVVEGLDTNEEEKDAVQMKLLPSPKVSINGSVENEFGAVSGNDSEACKWTSSFCATLGYGIKFLNQTLLDGSFVPQTIQFIWNMTYTEKSIMVSKQDVTVVGTTSSNLSKANVSRSLLQINSSISSGLFLFTVKDSALLKLRNLDIDAVETCGVFDLTATGHSLTLDSIAVICKVGPTHQYPLVRTEAGPVSVSNCVFNTTKGSDGVASFSSPVFLCSTTNSLISFSSTKFDSLCTTDCPVLDLTTDGALQMKSVSFSACSQTDSENDTVVLVSSKNLDNSVTPSLWEGSFTPTTPLSKFLCRNTNLSSTDDHFESSLLFHLIRPSDAIICGDSDGEESTHPNCGSDRLRCSSIEPAYRSMVKRGLGTILVNTDIPLESSFTVASDMDAQSDTSTLRRVRQVGSSTLSVDGSGTTVSFTRLLFSVSSTPHLVPLISSTDSTLNITSCSFEASTVIDSLLLKAVGCLIVMNDVHVSNIQSSLPLLETAATLEMSECTFDSITRTTTGPTILSATASTAHRVSLKTTKFQNCLSEGFVQWVFLFGEEGGKERPQQWEGTFNLSSPRTGVMISRDGEASNSEGMGGYSLLYEFYPRSDRMHVRTDTTSEDHALCGSIETPCRTVDGGFSSTNEPNIAIVGSGSLEQRIDVDGINLKIGGYRDHGTLSLKGSGQIVNGEVDELDSVSISSLVVDVSLSSLEAERGVFENVGGRLVFSSVNVTSSTELKGSLVKVTGGELSLVDSQIGSLTSSSPLLSLTSFSSVSILNLIVSEWAGSTLLDAQNGEGKVSIRNSLFDGRLSPNSISNCTCKTDKEEANFNVTLAGTQLIPCGLLLEVFEATNPSKSQTLDVSSLAPTEWNETSIVFSLTRQDHLASLSKTEEWRGFVRFGDDCRTVGDFKLKISLTAAKKAEAIAAMKWMIPVVCGVAALLVLLLIVVIVVCRRRRNKEKKETKKDEMGDLDNIEELKIEERLEDWTDRTANVISVGDSSKPLSDHNHPTKEGLSHPKDEDFVLPSDAINNATHGLPAEVILALKCSEEKMPEVRVHVRETLYHRLHQRDGQTTPLNRVQLRHKVARALLLAARVRPTAPVLSQLTPHWVLFDGNDEMFFRLEPSDQAKHPSPLPHPAQQTQSGNHEQRQGGQTQNEAQRWVPPEVADGKPVIDTVHGTVFRLGLVLWEIETGQIPFGEVDGINAQRQLAIGIVPRMDNVVAFMRELIQDCLSVDPIKRPPLEKVVEVLKAHLSDNEKPNENENEVPGQKKTDLPSNLQPDNHFLV